MRPQPTVGFLFIKRTVLVTSQMLMESQFISYVTGDPLSEKNFLRLSRFVYDYCGIRITPKKRSMVDGRLRRRMRALNIDDINTYCQYLFDGGDTAAKEVVHFIDAITTNKTDFFREIAHFDYLRDHILPTLAQSGSRTIKFWSAASSTGAEAYTAAMVLEDYCGAIRGMDYWILATDICTAVLAKGLSGRYPLTMIDPIPPEMRRRHLMVSRDPSVKEFRIVPQLRAKVAFSHINLMDATYAYDRDFDIVFCRNTLIYFDRPTQAQVLRRLCDHIRPGGYLFLGHSESVTGIDLPIKIVANTIFQRR